MAKARNLLLMATLALVLIGLSYAMTAQQVFGETTRIEAHLIEFVPEECAVTSVSRGVFADIEFMCDNSGNIIDKTHLNLIAKGVYEGSRAGYRIALKNVSEFPLMIDEYRLEVDPDNFSLAGLIYFSGSVKIYRGYGEYYDLLGTFEMVQLEDLPQKLTSIMEYRKIEANEKIVLELDQHFHKDKNRFVGKSGLSYELKPVFVQYFPSRNSTRVAWSGPDEES